MSHALGSCKICQNGWRYTEPFEDPIDDSVTPGRTEVTLDIPHPAYAAASFSPALHPLAAQIEASNYYQGMKRMDEKDIGLPLQWSPAALAQAVLDQQVLRRAFIENFRIGKSSSLKTGRRSPRRGGRTVSRKSMFMRGFASRVKPSLRRTF